jgi:UDP-N-acetylmuramoyl-tripeptide--D-alanyl-D-alanine ligase
MDTASLYNIYLEHSIICTDTRKIQPGCIFFALKGPNFNGNAFAHKALQDGAAFAIIDEAAFAVNERCVLVNDVLTTLQELATYHRQQLKIPVIAIVGSNGKTTTKELITSVLQTEKNVLATPGNFNNHIGLPLTLLMLKPSHEIAIIEMGANHVGENALLCEIAQPTHGLITNNGKDHLEGFGSIEGVAQSNSELYYYLLKNDGLAFVNAHDEWLMRMAGRLTKKITYSGNDEDKKSIADVMGNAHQLRPEIKFSFEDVTIKSSLSGDYNFDNIMAAVAIGKSFGIDSKNIKKGIESYEPKNNRSQVINKKHNTIYLDAYNANPSSMEASLRNFAAMNLPNSMAILGDMFELGKYADEEHRNMIKLCTSLHLEKVLFVGENFYKCGEGDFDFVKTTVEAAKFIREKNLTGHHIFLKGSRGIKLETLLDCID